MQSLTRKVATAVVCMLLGVAAHAEDGYELWLRYAPLDQAAAARIAPRAVSLHAPGARSETLQAALDELARGLGGLLGVSPAVDAELPDERPDDLRGSSRGGLPADLRDGAIVLATPQRLPLLSGRGRGDLSDAPNDARSDTRGDARSNARSDALGDALALDTLGDEGYAVRRTELDGRDVTLIAANTDIGVLYGAFALLRHLDTGGNLERIDLRSAPRIDLRVLNHWDNLDRSIERGYAGRSLWDWLTLPEHRSERYVDYARANASIGINGTVLNNVNANADILTAPYLEKVAALADVFRPYGIRVYLSARFSAPIEVGGLRTADPLDAGVRRWWRDKADEIYAAIPDFGGFLVKANSEGQPGPHDYGRSHAEGANMLAEALAPHGGVVMWRAFVYSAENPEDRAKQAYDEFVPLDGQFAPNVIVQVKNGPIDFQPREPFHPLFGAMPNTPLMIEFQITKEYLGFASHLVYLGPMYEEVLAADTHVQGPGSTVAKVADGSLHGHALTAMAGVANTGDERDWSGSTFNQANWYVYGRFAWDPRLTADAIAREWLAMTFSRDDRFIDAAAALMQRSREAPVDYMTPLGLAHLMATGHHYGPGPWVSDLGRPEWNPVYYHRADADGIGFDRTPTGSGAVLQYAPPVAERFADRDTVGDEFLLWFHRVGWDERLDSGRTLWEELVHRYDVGVEAVRMLQRDWAALEPHVDAGRFRKTAELLEVQLREARWWRDASIAYFQSVSGRPLPAGVEAPPHDLEHYRAIRHPYAPH